MQRKIMMMIVRDVVRGEAGGSCKYFADASGRTAVLGFKKCAFIKVYYFHFGWRFDAQAQA